MTSVELVEAIEWEEGAGEQARADLAELELRRQAEAVATDEEELGD